MKKLLIIGLGLLTISARDFANASYGYIKVVENQYSDGTLYIASTDPTPGNFDNNPACQISKIESGKVVGDLRGDRRNEKFYVPWENTGGKIYVWLKNKDGKVISAAKLYDENDIVYFEGDTDMLPGNANVIADSPQKNKSECQRHDALSKVQDVYIKLTATAEGKIQFKYQCPEWSDWNSANRR